MAEDSKSCVICGGTESEGELLLAAPCHRHFVCHDDVSSFFERATQNESLFPPKCCGQMFMLEEYEDYVPFDVAWAYQIKEQGEYAVLAKFRVYCANPPCAKFLQPTAHIKNSDTNVTYAMCEDEACGKLTCVGCKMLLENGTQNHVCKKNEEEEKFKQIATEKGYQECNVCGATVELAEACNHITCECGHDFCYVCGKDWPGLHGCPHYGPAIYDSEAYNQDGYHRDTGLNRDGLTRRQELVHRRGEDPDDDDPDDEDEDDDPVDDDPDWEVLEHLTPDQRVIVNTLHGNARADALDQLRITLFETQGIMFGNRHAPHPEDDEDEDADEDADANSDDDEQSLPDLAPIPAQELIDPNVESANGLAADEEAPENAVLNAPPPFLHAEEERDFYEGSSSVAPDDPFEEDDDYGSYAIDAHLDNIPLLGPRFADDQSEYDDEGEQELPQLLPPPRPQPPPPPQPQILTEVPFSFQNATSPRINIFTGRPLNDQASRGPAVDSQVPLGFRNATSPRNNVFARSPIRNDEAIRRTSADLLRLLRFVPGRQGQEAATLESGATPTQIDAVMEDAEGEGEGAVEKWRQGPPGGWPQWDDGEL